MRGRQDPQSCMLAFLDPESLIPLDHPLRTIRAIVDAALAELSPLFDGMDGDIWLDEDSGWVPADPLPRRGADRLGRVLRGHGV